MPHCAQKLLYVRVAYAIGTVCEHVWAPKYFGVAILLHALL